MTGAHKVRVLIVADVRLYREGMHASLSTRPQFVVVAAVSSVDEALAAAAQARPDVVIIDMTTPGSLAAARQLRAAAPDVHVVGFGVEQEGEILTCAEAGFSGYVPCEASLDDLVANIDSVSRGELLCTPKMAAILFRRLQASGGGEEPPSPRLLDLTIREREVLKLIDLGLSNKEIAVRLRIEISTVKNHVHNVLEKLQVTTRMQAARVVSAPAARGRGVTTGAPSPRE